MWVPSVIRAGFRGPAPSRRWRPRVEELEGRIVPTTVLQPPLHFDFGTSQTPVAPGYTGVSLVGYSTGRGYGWRSLTGLVATDRGTADPLTRDQVQGPSGTFLVNVPNGTYDVAAWLGDPKYTHEKEAVWAEGKEVASALTTAPGQFLYPTFEVTVADGQLSLKFADQGGANPNFSLCALDIVPATAGSPLTGFYVSPQGSDSNDGRTPATAFQTIANALIHVSYGLTVYLGAGTYYEQVVSRMDGAAGQPITLTSYNGTAVIDGSTQTWTPGSNQNQGLIQLRNPYYTVEGLTVLNSPNSGIVLGANNLTVDGSTVGETQRHGINTDTTFQPLAPGNGTLLRNITVTNDTVYHAVLKGQGYGQAVSIGADGFQVGGSTVHDNATEGIDIWLGARHGEVAGNTVYGNANVGIYVDGASYVRIDRNTAYDNQGGIGVSSENPNYSTSSIWVYNNVAHDNSQTGISIWDSDTNPGHAGSQNVLIANNTLVNNPTSIYLHGSGNTAEIMNNLSYTTGYNVYNSAVSSTFNIHNNVWLADLNGFVSPTTGDYRLTATSPAINQGAPIPSFADDLGNTYTVTTDFLGLNRVVGGAPDAGAYEYQG
jgi:parallel beta-helix repeat protein